MKRLLAASAAVVLVPVVLLAAAVGAVVGTAGPGVGVGMAPALPVAARGAYGLAVAAAQAGFTDQALRLAVAIGLAESGGNPAAQRPNPPTAGCPAGSVDRGAWQLNSCYHAEVPDGCAYTLACAAQATYRISGAGSDWSAWTTYTSGAYLAQLGAADHAITALVPDGAIPPGYGTPGPCGLSPATDYLKHLVIALFGVPAARIGGCALFTGHVPGSDHYPDANGQAHAIDVGVGANTALGWQVATWAAANAAALHVKYVIFAGQMIDFRTPSPTWQPCQDPVSSCATEHFTHVHISTLPNA